MGAATNLLPSKVKKKSRHLSPPFFWGFGFGHHTPHAAEIAPPPPKKKKEKTVWKKGGKRGVSQISAYRQTGGCVLSPLLLSEYRC